MPPTYFHGKFNGYEEHRSTVTLIEQILTYKMLFLSTVTVKNAQLTAVMNSNVSPA